MSFVKFVFSFLYIRDWNTGRKELSRSRVFLFLGILFLILLALIIVGVLQAPIYYSSI